MMEAIEIIPLDPEPEPEPAVAEGPRRAEPTDAPSPDESGIRKIPEAADDLSDLTDDLVELGGAPERCTVPPPVPAHAKRRPSERVDFEQVLLSYRPKSHTLAADDEMPSIPGIPSRSARVFGSTTGAARVARALARRRARALALAVRRGPHRRRAVSVLT